MKRLFAKFLERLSEQKYINSSTKSNPETQLRYENLLNYWFDIELYDLPECPYMKPNKLLSIPATEFLDKITTTILPDLSKAKDDNKITKNTKLSVMFQCHLAGYIINSKKNFEDITSPISKIPKTFLVAHSFKPQWDSEKNEFLWSLSDDDSDFIVNLATIRTLWIECPSEESKKLSFSQWSTQSSDELTAIFNKIFKDNSENKLFNSKDLAAELKKINRKIASKFWPDKESHVYMRDHTVVLEKEVNDLNDNPSISGETLTYPWRFNFAIENDQLQQLGPFYLNDLQYCLDHLNQYGESGLSHPLRKYLLGSSKQKELPSVTNNGSIYLPLTHKIPKGRWPSDPKHGLSLLQTVAVNVALDFDNNPIVAVNGPPGTGKTTLLKDIIADHFVERTIELSKIINNQDWFESATNFSTVLKHSVLVASSNNKAVENISKELPSKQSIHKNFIKKIKHLSFLSHDMDWGIFCAVLGNSTNRNTFKKSLVSVQNHLKSISQHDVYGLNVLVRELQSKDEKRQINAITKFLKFLNTNEYIQLLIEDMKKCSNVEKQENSVFFKPFIAALTKIDNQELPISKCVETFHNLPIEQWEIILNAFSSFKKQWFGKKLGAEFLDKRHKLVTSEFFDSLEKYKKYIKNNLNQISAEEYLTTESSYQQITDEADCDTEERLHLKSPFSSENINDLRSQLFVSSLKYNEVILEKLALSSSLSDDVWSDLKFLIDGNLKEVENISYYEKLWSLLFLIYPVVSTSLSSVSQQFSLMKKPEGFGVVMIDEAGQAVNYHVIGLLQRCQQAIFVGDPVQIQPVITIPDTTDRNIAESWLKIASDYNEVDSYWAEKYLVTNSSAQEIADNACQYYSMIGTRKLGIPLLVHRRCLEPMFSIANKIAYDHKMISQTSSDRLKNKKIIASGWLNVDEGTTPKGSSYSNETEANVAIDLVKYIAENCPMMLDGGVYLITPFSSMKKMICKQWDFRSKKVENHKWMKLAAGHIENIAEFSQKNIGTVHTFQGKEAATVILCLAASNVRNKSGGIRWINSKPNLINVAITRAKRHLFVIGNYKDWGGGEVTEELQENNMAIYSNLDHLKSSSMVDYGTPAPINLELVKDRVEFNFGG